MHLTRLSLSNPVAVIAAISLVALLGGIGLESLPVQMIPDVQRPFIQINTELQRALIEVMNRLNQVPRYPNDVTEPQIFAGQDSFGEPIAWFDLTVKGGNPREIASYSDFVREVVLARIERVQGISNANSFGGRDQEVRITFDPYETAALGIDIPTLLMCRSKKV